MSFSESYSQVQMLSETYKTDIEVKANKTFEQFQVLEYNILEDKNWFYQITVQTGENEKVSFQISEYEESRFFRLGYNVVVSPIA